MELRRVWRDGYGVMKSEAKVDAQKRVCEHCGLEQRREIQAEAAK